MTTIHVNEPAGGRARFRHRTPSEALGHVLLEEIPGTVTLPALPSAEDYYQVTLRRQANDGGQWAETFAIQPPDDGTYDLEDEETLPRMSLGEAAAGGGFALTDRVAALEGIVEDNLLGTVQWHEAAGLPASVSGDRDLLITLPGGEYATGHVRVSLHVVTEDVRGLERFTTSSVPSGVPVTAVPLAEGDTHRHLVQVDYPAEPGERQLRLRFRPSSGTISGRVGHTRPVFGTPREGR
ncbi:hypothetical protein [uncultured Stenotrophomonas sp.]|uniref:hypothetical protein n=1 Tax=uncultured Stenotrophomonas sp. TaxID=165438 RepID=UPI0025CDD6D7|nr:hypothetical protein [uncultured Stenotrophomonas sp.]